MIFKNFPSFIETEMCSFRSAVIFHPDFSVAWASSVVFQPLLFRLHAFQPRVSFSKLVTAHHITLCVFLMVC
jgi:hypothetical protein